MLIILKYAFLHVVTLTLFSFSVSNVHRLQNPDNLFAAARRS
jgi:hypothetical protein